ncbi:hypothetical protein ES288_D08G198700v1 [Gossypium darwinii]|uniref:Uncharacterized protein n=1 Tax=Gossypium darwinii TaxID=34276 RepID=A0A5D2BL83_GOSDA|nr:hypothetical protein ES288_D08G198700v1 [Gossypium darwinii]
MFTFHLPIKLRERKLRTSNLSPSKHQFSWAVADTEFEWRCVEEQVSTSTSSCPLDNC